MLPNVVFIILKIMILGSTLNLQIISRQLGILEYTVDLLTIPHTWTQIFCSCYLSGIRSFNRLLECIFTVYAKLWFQGVWFSKLMSGILYHHHWLIVNMLHSHLTEDMVPVSKGLHSMCNMTCSGRIMNRLTEVWGKLRGRTMVTLRRLLRCGCA